MVLALAGILIVYVMEYFEKKSAKSDNQANTEISFSIAAAEMQAPSQWMLTNFGPDETVFSSVDMEIPIRLDGVEHQISVTLLPSSKAAPSAYLLDTLYIHKFDNAASGQSYGLIIKKLKDEAGFEDEEIWYDALSARPFVAKCLNEGNAQLKSKNCITTILVNKRVSALIKFEQGLMPQWRTFSAAISEKLNLLNKRP